MSIIDKLKSFWKRKPSPYRVDKKCIYFSETNPFYFATHEDWEKVGRLTRAFKQSPALAANEYSEMNVGTPERFGELIIDLLGFSANAFSKNEKALSVATQIIQANALEKLEEHDKRYLQMLLGGTLHNHFSKIPENMVGMRVYKPDMDKVHPELKKIFLLNLDNVEFKTE